MTDPVQYEPFIRSRVRMPLLVTRALGFDLDSSQDATDTNDVAPGSDHKGAIGGSVAAREHSGRFGADRAVVVVEGSDSKREQVARE
jgi:hypothetical protein